MPALVMSKDATKELSQIERSINVSLSGILKLRLNLKELYINRRVHRKLHVQVYGRKHNISKI